ncbi:MAG TPA: hypothetical protein VFU17_15475, partial [Candidatus Limnocylindrales bacterium]|nr:hypothetical protein [Candidatus Limnocylindrales bacterium]
VVCAWRNLPPSDREAWFPDNVRRVASEQGRIALLRTETLYRAVLQQREGADLSAFMSRLFDTSGEAEL